jgi:hypothetical protein
VKGGVIYAKKPQLSQGNAPTLLLKMSAKKLLNFHPAFIDCASDAMASYMSMLYPFLVFQIFKLDYYANIVGFGLQRSFIFDIF